jgi:molecular chaperone DnaJ
MGRCYYKILGISIRATEEQIRRSFRVLALKYHPDRNPRNPEASARFREAVEAYENLIDESKRDHYDRIRGFGRKRERARFRRDAPDDETLEQSTCEEVLEEFFGVRPDGRREMDCRYDLRFDLQIPLDALRDGAEEEITFGRAVFCPVCSNGRTTSEQEGCRVCGGTGEVVESCSLKISIPSGLRHGSRLRLRGWGDRTMPGCAPGDLVILLYVVD